MSDVGGGGYWTVLLDAQMEEGITCPTLTFQDVTTTWLSADGDIDLPAMVVAGDLLVLLPGTRYSGTDITGWTTVEPAVAHTPTYIRIADGTEGGDVLAWLNDGSPTYTHVLPFAFVRYTSNVDLTGTPVFTTSPPTEGIYLAADNSPTNYYIPNGNEVSYVAASWIENGNVDTYSPVLFDNERAFETFDDANHFAFTVVDLLGRSTVDGTSPDVIWDAVSFSQFDTDFFALVCAAAIPGGVISNDDFVDAFMLPDSSETDAGVTYTPDTAFSLESLSGYTKETDEPDHNGNVGGHSAWFSWEVLADGTSSVYIEAGWWDDAFVQLLGVYTGASVDALTPVTPTDYTEDSGFTWGDWPVSPGTYYIAIDAKDGDAGTAGTYYFFILSS